MKFITLERRDIDRSYYSRMTDTVECLKLKFEPVTINPKYIVSMVEVFDGNEFVYTRIELVDTTYNVTPHVDEIVKMVNEIEEG